ncbi:helix-turn-helix domain containing protein [Streptomyces sp. AD681]|uniref:TetR/AcrR family transcriptional regulator n=1 Tax=Streptomyces sp. AD681 TaxID=3019069 RepID=UPI0022F1DC6F|nr:TetR/AcrR family transcriptional regulator [Streptomyces sp. AD681]MDA5145852.1 helix-turn-helix domain containing protein [Streptomyces sp. AD681]
MGGEVVGAAGKPRRVRMTPGARRVLEAAERLFYAHGIHAVGVDLIAAEAGVTKKTLYDRFGSKEQIVVEYLAGRDERWRELLAGRLEAAGEGAAARVEAVFEASRVWSARYGAKGCSMINAHAEISDPAHPAHPVIVGQKRWMLDLFTGLAREIDAAGADRLARTLMLLHEGALVAHGVGVLPDPFDTALDQVRELLGR